MSASNEETAQPALVSIGAKIAPPEARRIRELIEAGVYLNEPDLVRDAIRRRLSEINVITCQDIDYETANEEIRQAGGSIVDCYEIGDTLHGSKIYAESRKVDGPRVI